MEFGYFSLCLAARGQRVQCWNQPVQRSVHELQGAELPNAFGLQGRHGAVATAPGALPRAGRQGGSAAPLWEKPSGTGRGHYVTHPQAPPATFQKEFSLRHILPVLTGSSHPKNLPGINLLS